MQVPKEQLLEIVGELLCKMRCFLHKRTFNVVSYPDESIFGLIEEDEWKEEINTVQSRTQDYIEIEPISSRESFQIMVDFTEQLADNGARMQLIKALEGKKPFAHFNSLIHQMPEYHKEKWFSFREGRLLDFVKHQVEHALS